MTLKILRRLLPDWGTTYGPPGDGPFPGVMIFHGSEGAWSGWSHRNAVILAAHGFLAFPFGYSNGGNAWNAGDIVDVPLDRTVDALAALRAFPLVRGQKVGFYGVSRGAEHALLLASLMVRDGLSGVPDAIAAHSPPDVVCGGFEGRTRRDAGDPGWQSWDAKRAWSWGGSSDELLPTTPIEIERFGGPLFLSHGTADRVWSVDMTRRLADRLHQHGRSPEVHYYEGQDHLPGSAAENEHHEHLIAFFERSLAP